VVPLVAIEYGEHHYSPLAESEREWVCAANHERYPREAISMVHERHSREVDMKRDFHDQILACTCIRMSSSQQEASPEQQRAALLQLAAKHNARVVAEYFDEGISGIATDRRRGFQQMLEDAKAGRFKLILAWDQDRFSRLDSIDSGEIIAPLRRAGVRLVTCAQGEIDWISFAGRLVFNVQQEGKNQYLVDLSRNTVRGRVAAAKDGKKHGATNYGYDRLMFDEKNRRMCRIHFRDVFRKPSNWTAKLVQSTDVQAVKTVRWMFRAIAYEGYSRMAPG
jgi:DNA invertase Pin-like site-specific DNA recombinase